MLLGLHMMLLIGPTLPVPAPAPIVEALRSVQVTCKDEGRSGFQLTFETGRAGPADLLDYPLVANPLLRAFNRVILVVRFNLAIRVLMDGIITHRTLTPGEQPGSTTLTLTGEDVSVMMDLEQKRQEHLGLDETLIVPLILMSYMAYGIIPDIRPPPIPDPALPVERVPTQQGSDLEYLKTMAGRFGYVFYIDPGPGPGANTAYWGPPKRSDAPQPALAVDMGPATNVLSLHFETNALAPAIVRDHIQDQRTQMVSEVFAFSPSRPPLALLPAWAANFANTRRVLLPQGSGKTFTQAMAHAQGIVDRASDGVVTASGELDAVRYGDLLKPRGVVGVRGAGLTHDGQYYVKSVTHKISRGSYKQNFTLTREGDFPLAPVVRP